MYRFGIVEDEPEQYEQLQQFILRYCSAHNLSDCRITIYDTSQKLLDSFHGQFDVLLLDIQLPDMLGIEAAARIREQDENVILIFVTNLSQYAIDGYAVRAFDYVLKPLLYDAFAAKLDRVIRLLDRKRASRILTLKSKQETRRLSSDKITYIESMRHDLMFHTQTGTITIWGTLTAYEKELAGVGFSRCNASFLVNLRYVERICGNNVLVAGKALPIGKTRRKQFLSDFAGYKGGTV